MKQNLPMNVLNVLLSKQCCAYVCVNILLGKVVAKSEPIILMILNPSMVFLYLQSQLMQWQERTTGTGNRAQNPEQDICGTWRKSDVR